MTRPRESDYTSHTSYTRALEAYCDFLENSTGYGMTVDGVPIPDYMIKKAVFLYMTNQPVQKPHEFVHDPAEIRRVFELDDAQRPDPDSGFALLGGL